MAKLAQFQDFSLFGKVFYFLFEQHLRQMEVNLGESCSCFSFYIYLLKRYTVSCLFVLHGKITDNKESGILNVCGTLPLTFNEKNMKCQNPSNIWPRTAPPGK